MNFHFLTLLLSSLLLFSCKNKKTSPRIPRDKKRIVKRKNFTVQHHFLELIKEKFFLNVTLYELNNLDSINTFDLYQN